jgi:hypothetical protein
MKNKGVRFTEVYLAAGCFVISDCCLCSFALRATIYGEASQFGAGTHAPLANLNTI